MILLQIFDFIFDILLRCNLKGKVFESLTGVNSLRYQYDLVAQWQRA